MLDVVPRVDSIILTFVETGARVENQHSTRLKTTQGEARVPGRPGRVGARRARHAAVPAHVRLLRRRDGPDDRAIDRVRNKRVRKLPNVIGYVARTDRHDESRIVNTPTEINLFPLKGASEGTSNARIHLEFAARKYGLLAAPHVARPLACSPEIVPSTQYTVLGAIREPGDAFGVRAQRFAEVVDCLAHPGAVAGGTQGCLRLAQRDLRLSGPAADRQDDIERAECVSLDVERPSPPG